MNDTLNRSRPNRLLQLEQDLLSLRQLAPQKATAGSRVMSNNRRQLLMNAEHVSRNTLLEMEQELNLPVPQIKHKKPKAKHEAETKVKAQVYDFNEPIELSFNSSYHLPAATTSQSHNRGIVLPLTFGSSLNAGRARYYVEPFEDNNPFFDEAPADSTTPGPAAMPPAPTEILLRTVVQPLNPIINPGAPPSISPPGMPAAAGPGFNWDALEGGISPLSSQESLALDEESSDFIDKLQAVVSGNKSPDPTAPQTPQPQPPQAATPPAPPMQPSQPETPSQQTIPPGEPSGPHALFDQMGAAGLAYATTYNLGPVALEERFNAFDQSIPARAAYRAGSANPESPESLPVMPVMQHMDLIEDFTYMSQAASAPALSGASWVSQFPTSISVDDLEPGFREKVKKFQGALAEAGAITSMNATRRPKERAYLMHWSWSIVKQGHDASQVPAMPGVNINWNHGSQEKSKQAAQEMVDGYGIDNLDVAPALNSRHIEGKAVDMEVSWTGDLTIKKADGSTKTITSEPRNHTNTDLIEVAKTYGVVHFTDVNRDKVHWSTDGH